MIGQSAGKSFAYLLGTYLGDGCVTYTGAVKYLTFRLNTIDRDFTEAVASALEVVCGKKPNVNQNEVKRGRTNYYLGLRHQELCERLQSETQEKAIIPAYVWGWSVDEKRAFIAGLMDSEGFVAKLTNAKTNRGFYMGFKCTSPWTTEFAQLMETIGVRIGKVSTELPRKPGYKAPTRFHIKMQSWKDAGCYFNIARKQSRVEEFFEAGPYERRAVNPRRLTSETTCQEPLETAVVI